MCVFAKIKKLVSFWFILHVFKDINEGHKRERRLEENNFHSNGTNSNMTHPSKLNLSIVREYETTTLFPVKC